MWTAEHIREIVPVKRRKQYEDTYKKRKIDRFYERTAELQNLVRRETEWGADLDLKFQKQHCAFYHKKKHLFGVHFQGHADPRFYVRLKKKRAGQLGKHCKFERYDADKGLALYPPRIAVEALHPIFRAAYHKQSGIPQPVKKKVVRSEAAEQARSLVPADRLAYYEKDYRHKIDDFYQGVAELLEVVREHQWEETLELKFLKHYCAFYLERNRVFGIQLQSGGRFCIWLTEEEAEALSDECPLEIYVPAWRCALYARGTKVKKLRPALEAAYKKRSEAPV